MQETFLFRPTKSTSTLITINSVATSVTSLNSFRESFILTNISDIPIYINYGKTCDNVVYVCLLQPQAFLSDDFGGNITACTNSTTGHLVLTEKF